MKWIFVFFWVRDLNFRKKKTVIQMVNEKHLHKLLFFKWKRIESIRAGGQWEYRFKIR